MPTFSIYTSHIYCIYEVILELIHNAVLRLITITIYLTACLRVACMRVRVCAVAWHTLLLLVHCAITVDATIILAFSSCSAFDANGRSIEFCRDRGFKFCIFFFHKKKSTISLAKCRLVHRRTEVWISCSTIIFGKSYWDYMSALDSRSVEDHNNKWWILSGFRWVYNNFVIISIALNFAIFVLPFNSAF